jgi:adenosine deaminase
MSKYKTYPKIELHLHLDCSLSYEIVKKINPLITFEGYKNDFIAPAKCMDLADFISQAMRGFELMQTREELRLVTLDLFRQLKEDNVIYAEIRFAPLQHIYKELSPAEVVNTVNEAFGEGIRTTGVEAGIILCTLRHYSEEQSMATVQLVRDFIGTRVVGFDLAANEVGFPIDAHIKAFNFAGNQGISCTAHAGEAKGAESVWETLENLRPSRIGHGVRSIEDPKLLDYLRENNIHLEICPTSNIQTNVFDKMENHSINTIYEAGISVGINTDARTISNVTLTDEYETLARVFSWDKDHFLTCNLNALEHAFIPDEKKNELRTRLLYAYR